MKKITILFCMISILILSGCSTKNDNLFQNKDNKNFDDNITVVSNTDYKEELNYEYKIAVNDRLLIMTYLQLTSDSNQLNTALNSKGINIQIKEQVNIGQLVTPEGTVRLPLINTVKVLGLTQDQASALLIKKYKKYIKNPYVRVEIKNQRVIVLGEVNKPGIVNITNGTINLFEVIAKSGDITDLAERKNIKIIRGDLRNPEIKIVDLTDTKNLLSSSLLIKSNDIVYVQSREINGVNKAIEDLNPFFKTLSIMLNPFVQRKTLVGSYDL